MGETKGDRITATVVSQETAPNVRTYSASLSNGSTMNFEARLAERTKGAVPSVTSVSATVDGRFVGTLTADTVPLHTDGFGRGTFSNPMKQAEDAALGQGPASRMLRAALADFSELKEQIVAGKPSVRPAAWTKATGRAQCYAWCVRAATLAPIYICDDGYWWGCFCEASSGIWIMQCEDGFLWCWQSCNYWYIVP